VQAADRPNILLIVSEDNGPELGCYGEPSVKTPVLDKLAAGGILFERAYVPQAGCSRMVQQISRASRGLPVVVV
jgi:N-sulfoglucosamine sulfohydrolase